MKFDSIGRAAMIAALSLALPVFAVPTLGQTPPAGPFIPSGPTENPASAKLRDAVMRLANDPRNVFALIDAGEASIALGDGTAARGFYERANAIRPNDGRIKAGLASSLLREENPFEALRLFDEAVKLGQPVSAIAADRGLAFDLLGNSERALADYRLAAQSRPSDDLTVRMAITMGLSGQTGDADRLLAPLLERRFTAAWRARAFYLAAAGKLEDSYEIARGFMDPTSALTLRPFLARMPRLTRAQQAAAVHFGHFPKVDAIGKDSDRVRELAAATGVKPKPPEAAKPAVQVAQAKAKPAKKLSRGEQRRLEREKKKREDDARKQAQAESERRAKAEALAATERDRLSREAEQRRIADAKAAEERRLAEARAAEERRIADARAAQEAEAQRRRQELADAEAARQAATQQAATQAPTDTAPAATMPTQPTQLAAVTPPAAPGFGPSSDPGSVAGPTADGTPLAIARPPVQTAPPPAAALPPPTAPVAEGRRSLGDIVSAIEVPTAETVQTVAPVDLSNLPKLPPKPKVEDEPTQAVRKDEPKAAPKADLNPATGKAWTAKDKAALEKGDMNPKTGKLYTPREKTAMEKAGINPRTGKAYTAREKAALEKAKKKEPAHPARIWVQIATGANVKALAYDWNKLQKSQAKLYGGREAWSSPWGRTRRLVVGPFKTLKDAKAFEVELRKGGGDGFVWQSEDGVVVEALP